MSQRIDLFDFTRQQLTEILANWGYSQHHAQKLWRSLYRELVVDVSGLSDARPDLRLRLEREAIWPQADCRISQQSRDGYTQKFLLAQPDGETIETVIMRFHSRRDRPEDTNRYTACISTQAGCAMGCVFCATGQMGFRRHLTAADIVRQVVYVQRILREQGAQLRNIVLMGMGEPLHNYDNTMRAIDIITDHLGLSLAPSRITLSTVGLPAGILRLADDHRPINLAVSLHGATDAERQALVPPAKRWPLSALMAACRTYTEKRQRRIFFEWTLIAFQNDTPAQAHALGQLLKGMAAHVNVIPLNPTAGYDGQPSNDHRVKAFQQILSTYDLPSTIRQRRGIDIAAGCGQLQSATSAR